MALRLPHLLQLTLLLVSLTGPLPLHAQVVDESTPHVSHYVGVGATGSNYAAQSFYADVTVINKIGAWLKMDVPNSKVTLKLVAATPTGEPDVSTFLYETPLIVPDPNGLFYNYGGFTVPVIPGNKYFLVVDGYQNFTATGRAGVGLSTTYTDSNEDMVFSTDAGLSWDTLNTGLPMGPMCIYIEGDTCSANPTLSPANPILCPGGQVMVDAGAGFNIYDWSNGDSTQTVTVTAPGTYAVTVVSPAGCVGFDSVTVTLTSAPSVVLAPGYSYCAGDSVTITAIADPGSLLWSQGDTTATVTLTVPGAYSVTVTDANGCSDADTTTVIENPLPAPVIGPSAGFCTGGFYVADAGAGYLTYDWSTGATSRTISITSAGQFTVTVSDLFGCVGGSDTLTVVLYPDPTQPQIVLTGNSLQSTPAPAWQWFMNTVSLSGETGEFYSPATTGYYQVMAIDSNGCTALSDSFYYEIIIPGDFIPTGFSPNGDGINDVFFIERAVYHPENEFVVFNRWGDKVFSEVNYDNDWGGKTRNGDTLPDGNYFWVLEFRDGTPSLSGPVIINR